MPNEEEDSSETEVMLNEATLEVLINLSLALQSDFVQIFGSFKDIILAKFNSKSKPLRVGSIGAIAEMVEGMKEANPYSEELLQIFSDKLANDKSIKGNAAYGIGLIIQYSSVDLFFYIPTHFAVIIPIVEQS